jgi:tetratricopeptide (TPR) repeat protein
VKNKHYVYNGKLGYIGGNTMIIEALMGIFTGVVGNGIYSCITKEDLMYRVSNAYEIAHKKFYEFYGDEYGDKFNSFLTRQENIDLIINSFNFGEESLKVDYFNKYPYDSSKCATNKIIDTFILLFKQEIRKDFELNRLLAEKEHIIEQQQMHKQFTQQMGKILEMQTRLYEQSINDKSINFDEIMNIYNEQNIIEQDYKLIRWLHANKCHKEGIILKAHIEYNRGSLELAKKIFDFIIEEYEEEFEYNNTIALIDERFGRLEDAVKRYHKVLERNPRSLNSLFNLGTLYAKELEKYEDGLKYLLIAKEVAPNDSEVLNNIGVLYKEKFHDYSNAERYFELAIECSKINPLPFINMGELYLEVYKEYNKAVAFFEGALVLAKENKEEIHNILGLIYGSIVIKDKAKSIMHFEEAIKINPHLMEARLNLNIIKSNENYFDMFKTLSSNKVIDLLKDNNND